MAELQAHDFVGPYELLERGARRRLRSAGRKLLAGLAACFVCLRYASVAGLLGSYAAVVYWTLAESPAVAFLFLPILFLHILVRWEGPETSEEAKLRRKGAVVSRGWRSR